MRLWQVSSLRNSQSDEKKFYIYTGTKTLHLRAETSADRSTWLEALQAAKDLFPRSSMLIGLVTTPEEITISTEKLRLKLIEHGMREEAVKECEDIMLAEFADVKEQLKVMQQRRMTLLDRLRLLEVIFQFSGCGFLSQVLHVISCSSCFVGLKLALHTFNWLNGCLGQIEKRRFCRKSTRSIGSDILCVQLNAL